jgi:hypothetical protein
MRFGRTVLVCIALATVVAACSTEQSVSTVSVDTGRAAELGLTPEEAASLASLEQVDDYPLYVMHHYAPEPLVASAFGTREFVDASAAQGWACSLFAALGDPDSRIFGRNFDWEFSPALLLFNHPADGYGSAAIVDIAYLGFPGDGSSDLTTKPLAEIIGLLDAPRIPFDGMNEAGLVIGMAAVPAAYVPADPTKETVDTLGIIRLMLDRAATVTEAIALMEQYNVDVSGQTPLHYLLADASGDAALVEYHAGELRIIRSGTPWHHATNFLLSDVAAPAGHCNRYDAITNVLKATGGVLDFDAAFDLLENVAQSHTQWSAVYSATSGEIRIAMGRDYERVHTFSLEMSR